jgi:hypothetical protein
MRSIHNSILYIRVKTTQYLTDTDVSYHIENLEIGTALSPPFHSECSPDPLFVLPGLATVNKNNLYSP